MEKKTYIISAGKHYVNGKVYRKGDKIELTEDEAKGLTNKIVDPATFGLTGNETSSNDEVQALKDRIAELEQENAELKEAIEGDD